MVDERGLLERPSQAIVSACTYESSRLLRQAGLLRQQGALDHRYWSWVVKDMIGLLGKGEGRLDPRIFAWIVLVIPRKSCGKKLDSIKLIVNEVDE